MKTKNTESNPFFYDDILFIKKITSLIILLGFYSIVLKGQNVQEFHSDGVWICPAGVSFVQIECWGGGGGGGSSLQNNQGGSGGGGGAYVMSNSIAVVPGTSYTVKVGAGGAGGSSPFSQGESGGDSWFGSNITVKAAGGMGGYGNMGAGGTGGGANNSIGDVKTAGDNGIAGTFNYGGAGGKGGGLLGGAGGEMKSTDGWGNSGQVPGGAGGGGYKGSSFNRNGGFGGKGMVIVRWEIAQAPHIYSFTPAIVCKGGNILVNGIHFTGATAVKINDLDVSFLVVDDENILIVVPVNATSGLIQVVTQGGIALSQTEIVVSQLAIENQTTISHPIMCVGNDVTISVYATTNSGELEYLWHHNGIPIINDIHYSGANTEVLIIQNVEMYHLGEYYCKIHDSECDLQSETVNFNSIEITEHPEDMYSQSGTNAFIEVNSNWQPDSYQWQVSNNNGQSWTDIHSSGANPTYGGFYSNILEIGANSTNDIVSENNGLSYRCILYYNEIPCELVSNISTLYVSNDIQDDLSNGIQVKLDHPILLIDTQFLIEDVRIYSLIGKLVSQTKENMVDINVLSKGVYVLIIQANKNSYKKKLIIP
jgi:hypothetical protein